MQCSERHPVASGQMVVRRRVRVGGQRLRELDLPFDAPSSSCVPRRTVLHGGERSKKNVTRMTARNGADQAGWLDKVLLALRRTVQLVGHSFDRVGCELRRPSSERGADADPARTGPRLRRISFAGARGASASITAILPRSW